MDRYICIHCHFYQPPRENPWLEAIELQDSAYPYHDWNRRITSECYAPNSASRILDSQNRILKIVNNYSNISFNFGPTLLSWMESEAPDAYEKILEADKQTREYFSGHGSALAQAYNHMILPLAYRRDKYTQVLWGIRDFQHRFGRYPEGMWLPETAVDIESLEVLAELGIKFTILAPHQARQVKRFRARAVWHNVEGGKIDTTQAYVCRLPSGRSINIFFYDGPTSRAVAFENLLNNGENFANRLTSNFSDARSWKQLVHIATDGETYGHHHPHGDMALTYALHYIESKNIAKITNYGEFLHKNPPKMEVEIIPNTSWSCSHGIERWRSDCGCNTGMRNGWNQQWRMPLREALDWLRDSISALYHEKAGALLKDPWAARDEYISVILDRSSVNLDRYFDVHTTHKLLDEERVTALKLLEMQRHAMLMYTSCGWFFDELSGIETVQVIEYAGRAIQLAEELFGARLEMRFLEKLSKARSNLPEYGDGAGIYNRWVKPGIVNLLGVGAHYAISSLFDHYGQQNSIYCYNVDVQEYHKEESGIVRLVLGRCLITSRVTLESMPVTFGVLHFGDHNLIAGVRRYRGQEPYQEMMREITNIFGKADLPGSLRQMDKYFEGTTYSLKSLFRDEQRRILDQIMEAVLVEADASSRQIYELHSPLMRFLGEVNMPLPRVLQLAAEVVLNSSIKHALNKQPLDVDRIISMIQAAKAEKVTLDSAGISFLLKNRMIAMVDTLLMNPRDIVLLEQMEKAASLARTAPLQVDLWKIQNGYYELLQTVFPQVRSEADPTAEAWISHFTVLGEKLGIQVQTPGQEMPAAA